jgi:hypothetical protein
MNREHDREFSGVIKVVEKSMVGEGKSNSLVIKNAKKSKLPFLSFQFGI